jgi:hypothetical protein
VRSGGGVGFPDSLEVARWTPGEYLADSLRFELERASRGVARDSGSVIVVGGNGMLPK